MAAPIHLAAIDAGSNAIRLAIARATSPHEIEILEMQRAPVRLGHNAFTRHRFDDKTIARAVQALREFRRRLDHFGVGAYRAVATSACREARNRRVLLGRIRRKAGINLEVISGEEEARLIRRAVLASLGGQVSPRLILDLGGGSLELNLMRQGRLERTLTLPLGAVRLMETYRISGAIGEEIADELRRHVLSVLRAVLGARLDLTGAVAVACGGNAEALAQLAPGARLRGIPTINLHLLRDRQWQLLRLDVPGRMREFGLRRDRAEVIGLAAIVLTTLGQWLRLHELIVPGVGVREGILLDLTEAQFAPAELTAEEKSRARVLLNGAQWFARRLNYNARHAEQVRRLALSLFDQLRNVHRFGPDERLLLELGAVLHDIGHFVHRKSHHRHGEYLIRNGEIPGLRGWRRDFVACLVRYHNNKDEPRPDHKLYASLNGGRRRQLRLLSALLRIAEKLESDHHQSVQQVDVQVSGGTAVFRVSMRNDARLDLAGVLRKAGLFEKEFGLPAVFRRALARQKKERVA